MNWALSSAGEPAVSAIPTPRARSGDALATGERDTARGKGEFQGDCTIERCARQRTERILDLWDDGYNDRSISQSADPSVEANRAPKQDTICATRGRRCVQIAQR